MFSRLILQLLDHEPKASDQVPLLLSMKEDGLALYKAVESGDTDLGRPNTLCSIPFGLLIFACSVSRLIAPPKAADAWVIFPYH